MPDVWSIKKVNPQKMVHLTEKPVELAARAMQYSSRPGENVLDLFGGSGSTLMAAEQTGRKAFLMELDPPYCDVIVERYEKFTGKKAERIQPSRETPLTPIASLPQCCDRVVPRQQSTACMCRHLAQVAPEVRARECVADRLRVASPWRS